MGRLQVVIGLLAAILVFMTGGSEVARADPDVVLAGHDLLETDSSGTYMELSLPPDYFGPGSDPFEGQVSLEGVPLGSFDVYGGLGPTDTIVERKTDAGTEHFPDTIEIEIVALELKSVEPITVSWGGNFYHYDVTVSVPEGDTEQETGSMTIEHDEGADGGTFDIEALPVRPLLTFFPLEGPGGTIEKYYPELPAPPLLVFSVSDEDWCHTANPLADPPGQVVIEKPGLTSNFFPGIVCGPPRKGLVVLASGSSLHSVKAAEKAAPAVGGIAELPDVSDSSGRNYIASAAAAAAAALAAGAWYARRRWMR